jgi:hypothetical protein
MSNNTPVRTRRSNTVNGRITESNSKPTLRKYKSSTGKKKSIQLEIRVQITKILILDITNLDTQQSWTHVTKLYTLCLEPATVSPSAKCMQKDHYENWWSQTPTLQSMA